MDIFDQITREKKDIFDQLSDQGDIFDKLSKKKSVDIFDQLSQKGDVFDQLTREEPGFFQTKVKPFIKGTLKEALPFKGVRRAVGGIARHFRHIKEHGLPEEEEWKQAEAIQKPVERMQRIKELEPIESSILEDPISAITVGGVMGGMMAARTGQAALQIAKESAKGAIGVLTYGATDIPGISKGIIKAARTPKVQKYLKESEEFVDDLFKHMNKFNYSPSKLTLENASSVAGLLLMTEAMVTDKPEKDPPAPPMPPGGGMGGMY